jgi:cell division protein FtsZ
MFDIIKKRDYKNDDPKIKVIGVGGAGTNIVNALYSKNMALDLISINTDWKQLSANRADKKLLIGFEENRGLGCGGDVANGKQSAIEDMDEIKKVLEDTELIILVGGIGKGTCTGALPEIAKEAKKMGALVVSFLTIPFFMRRMSIDKTEYALAHLKENVDTLILIDNNKLTKLNSNISFMDALYTIDKYVIDSITAILELIRNNELIEVDFSNIKSILENGKLGTIGISQVSKNEDFDILVENCLVNNLIKIKPKKATGALVQVIGDSTLSLNTLNEIVSKINSRISDDPNVVISAKIDDSMDGKIKLVLILNGMDYEELNLESEKIGLEKLRH